MYVYAYIHITHAYLHTYFRHWVGIHLLYIKAKYRSHPLSLVNCHFRPLNFVFVNLVAEVHICCQLLCFCPKTALPISDFLPFDRDSLLSPPFSKLSIRKFLFASSRKISISRKDNVDLTHWCCPCIWSNPAKWSTEEIEFRFELCN